MPIPERYADHRASDLSRRVCDVVLQRLARETDVAPQPQRLNGILFHDVGGNRYQLRTLAKSRAGEVWTNIGRDHPGKVAKANASYLCIGYSPANPHELTIYQFSPAIVTTHYADAGIPRGENGDWTLTISYNEDMHLVFDRSGAAAVVLPPGTDQRIERWALSEEESRALNEASPTYEAQGLEAGEVEQLASLETALINVSVAFDLLCDEIEEAYRQAKGEIAKASNSCSDRIRRTLEPLINAAEACEQFNQRAIELRDQWARQQVPESAREEIEPQPCIISTPQAARRAARRRGSLFWMN